MDGAIPDPSKLRTEHNVFMLPPMQSRPQVPQIPLDEARNPTHLLFRLLPLWEAINFDPFSGVRVVCQTQTSFLSGVQSSVCVSVVVRPSSRVKFEKQQQQELAAVLVFGGLIFSFFHSADRRRQEKRENP